MQSIGAAYSDNIQESLDRQVPLVTTIAEIGNDGTEDAVYHKKKLSNVEPM